MSILFTDGFDHYGTGSTSISNMLDGVYADITSTCSTSVSRTGTHSLNCTGTLYARRVLGNDYETVGVAGGYYFTQLPDTNNSSTIAQFRNSANTPQVSIAVSTVGEFLVKTGDHAGTIVATSGQVVTASTWQHVEVKLYCHASNGSVEIRLNGVTVLTASDLNTRGASTGLFSQIFLGRGGGAGSSRFHVDDLIVWEADSEIGIVDFVGMKRNYMILPDADTLVADFLKSTGSIGYSLIAKSSPNDATYIYAENPADTSEFEVAAVEQALVGIACVSVYTRAKKLDEGIANLQVSLVSETEVTSGADRPITTLETYYHDVFELDPATGSAWTGESVESALLRVEKTQ